MFLLPFIDVSLLLWACYCSPALRLLFVFPFFLFCVFLCASIQLTGAWWRRHANTLTGRGKMIVVVLHITTLGQDIRLLKNAESSRIPISSRLTPFIQLEKSISWTRISSRIRFSAPRLRQVLPKRGGPSSHPDEFCRVTRCNRAEKLPGMWGRRWAGFFT